MTDAATPLNRSAKSALYPQPAFGNPVSSLIESGVGNCFPGLEFDLRQLDGRFFPGLLFDFPDAMPGGPAGGQGARLVYVDTAGDNMLAGDANWVDVLNDRYAGDAGNALGSGTWFLHSVEQYGKKIDLYNFTVYENAIARTPYEGDTAWWIIRLIEVDPNPDVADLTISLTQRAADGTPIGMPVELKGKRRVYVNADGMIDEIYHPGELTSSMCSPWTHDFTDCGCQYWAANHPDIALGPVDQADLGNDGMSTSDVAQPLTFRDWLRRRDLPSADVAAATTIDAAQRGRYDHYEINQRWQELDFVLMGEETDRTPVYPPDESTEPYKSIDAVIEDITDRLAPLELTLSMEYLYAYFSLRKPEDITGQEAAIWPSLANDLRAVGEMLLSTALSEMTHMRWDNQILWTLDRAGRYPKGTHYTPVVTAAKTVPVGKTARKRALRSATIEVLAEFCAVERPTGGIDREYASLVAFFKANAAQLPTGLDEIAIRIDTDGLQHYHKFRGAVDILSFYQVQPPVYLRPLRIATRREAASALEKMQQVIDALRAGYAAEHDGDMTRARNALIAGRFAMQGLRDEAEVLAKAGLGVPLFAPFDVNFADD